MYRSSEIAVMTLLYDVGPGPAIGPVLDHVTDGLRTQAVSTTATRNDAHQIVVFDMPDAKVALLWEDNPDTHSEAYLIVAVESAVGPADAGQRCSDIAREVSDACPPDHILLHSLPGPLGLGRLQQLSPLLCQDIVRHEYEPSPRGERTLQRTRDWPKGMVAAMIGLTLTLAPNALSARSDITPGVADSAMVEVLP